MKNLLNSIRDSIKIFFFNTNFYSCSRSNYLNLIKIEVDTCYASTSHEGIREGYAIGEVCRRL